MKPSKPSLLRALHCTALLALLASFPAMAQGASPAGDATGELRVDAPATQDFSTLGLFTLPAGASVTLEFDVLINGSIPAGVTAVANQGAVAFDQAGAPLPTDDPTTGTADDATVTQLLVEAELGVTKSDNPASATTVPGTSIQYDVVVSNAGPFGVLDVPVSDTFPAALGNCSWSCGGTGNCDAANGVGDVNTTVDLEAGQSVTFVITCDVDPAATGNLVNTASATTPAGVSDPGNTANSDSDTNTLTPQGNLTISKVTNTTPLVPGGAIQYEITVANSGPSDAVGVDVDDTFPAAVTGVTWSCAAAGGATCPNANGAGDLAETVDLPAGGSLTYTVDGTVDAGASGSVVNTATLTVPAGFTDTTDGDAVAGSESDTVTDNLDPEGDVAVTKTTLTSPVVPGAAVQYEIEVTNTGPSDALGVTLTDTVPGSVSGVTWTCVASGAGSACSAAAGNGDLNEIIDVGAGGSVTYTVTGTVDAGATGDLVNTASVTPPAGFTDGSTGNDDDTVTDALEAQGNLSVDKTTLTSPVVAGLPVQYQVVVSNSGPSTATGAQVQDNFSPDLSNESWTCSATAGSSCTAAGNGDILDAVTLLPGGAATYTVTADVDAGAASPLGNTATVTPPAGFTDTDDSDDSDTVSNAVAQQADLSLVKDDGEGAVNGVIVYTITVTNAGPGDATGVTVTDVFPAGVSAVEWTCVGSGGATCTAGPVNGDVNDSADLPANSMVVYTVTATVDGSDPITNTASATLPAGVVDPNPDDNEDSVTTALAGILEIPTLSQVGLAFLVLLLAGLGLARLRRRGAVIGLALLLALAGAGAADAQVLIDDFSTAQGPNADPPGGPPPASSTADTAGADILGGERDLEMRRISGGGTVTGEVTGGQLDFDAPAGTRGEATLTWDGNDSDATALDPVGLGGADLTGGGTLSGFLLTIDQASSGVELILRVYTDGSNHSQAGRLISTAINAATPVFIPFGELQTVAGAGADPANVGAVVLVVRGLNATLLLDRVDTVGPNLVITKVDLDPNTNTELGATQVQAGSTIRYRIQLQNQGGDATTVDVNDMVGANTTLVANTLNSTPVAVGDAYRWFGNVTLVANGAGLPTLLGNDTDPDGDPITVTAIDASSARGGGVTLDNAATGAFTYVPPAGVRGIDTFGYSIQDNDGNVSTALATVQLEQTVWFVDSDACPGSPPCGTGTQADPFGELEQAQAASAPGDVIRLRQGSADTTNHDQGIVLKAGQQLIGEGVDLVLGGVVIEGVDSDPDLDPTPANRPSLTHGGAGGEGITLADNLTILGLNVDASNDSAVFGNNVDNVTIDHAAVIDSGGAAVELLNSTNLSLTFTGIDSLNSIEDAVLLDNVTGSLTVTGTTQLDDPVESGIQIINSPGFTATFGAVNVVDAGDAGAHAAVHLASNAGATITFGTLNLDSENGDGFFANGGGTVNHPSSGNVVNAVGGAAVDIQSTTGNAGGSPGWSFDTLTSTNSPDHGVRLVSLSDDFTVGSASTTVTDADGVGILVQNSAPGTDYDFGATTVTDTNVGAGATANGIDLATGNANATFTFDSLDVTTDGGFGLLANNSGSLTVNGADNDFDVTGGVALSVTSTTVAVTLDQVTVSNAGGEGVRLVSNTGNTSITDLQATTTNGVGLFADGAGTVNVTVGTITTTNRAAVDVNNTTTGITFTTLTSNTSNDHGVDLTNLAAGSTFTVTGVTDVNTTTNEGVMIANIGANAVLNFGATQVDNAGAEGIEINTVATGADLDFGPTDVTNRNATGIFVDEMDGTALDFGPTTIANPNGAGGYAIRTEDSAAAVTFVNAVVSNSAVTTAEVDANADFIPENEGDGDLIFLTRNTGLHTFIGGSLTNSGADAIDARQIGSLQLNGVTVQNPARHGVRGIDMQGSFEVQAASLFTQVNTAGQDAIRVINTISDSLAVIVDDSDFSNSVTGSNAVFLSGRSAADMDLTVRNGSTFANFGGSGVLVNAGDTAASTARIDLVVQNSQFSTTVANTLTTLAGQGLEAGTLTALIENNTFTNVARVASSNTGVITLNGNGTSSNEVIVRGNTINSPALATGYRGIQIFADNDSVYPATILIENNDVFGVDQEGLVLDVATNGGSVVNARITGNDFGSAANPVGTDGNERGVTIFTRRFNPDAPTANVLFDDNRVFISSTSSARQPLEITGENDATLNLTLTNSTIENLGTSDDGRFTTFENGTICLNMSGNDFGTGGAGQVNLRDFDPPTSSFDVVQASAPALSTANNSVSVVADATVSFNQPACPQPPAP